MATRHAILRALLIASAFQILSLDRAPAQVGTETRASISAEADTLSAQGQYANAEKLYRKALSLAIATSGENSVETAQIYDGLGAALDEQGRFGEAEALLRKSLSIYRAKLGDKHPATAASYNNYAISLTKQRRFAEAEPLYRRALEITRAARGEKHPDTVSAYENLAAALVELGKSGEAQAITQKVAAAAPAAGAAETGTTTSYNNQGYALYNRGNYAAADGLFRKALAVGMATLPPTHPDLGLTYSNLATNLVAQNRFAEAEPLYRQALDINLKTLGENHPYTVWGYSNLAAVLTRLGRFAEAEKLSSMALMSARQAERIALTNGTESGEKSRAGASTFQDAFNDYIGIAWDLAEADRAEAPRLRAAAFLTAQDVMVSSSAAAMAQARVRTAGGNSMLGQAVRREQDLAAQQADVEKKLLLALGQGKDAEATRLNAALDQVSALSAAASLKIDMEFPAYRELVSPRPLELADVQRALDPDEGLLLFLTSNDEIYSFAVTAKSVAWNRVDAAGSTRVQERIVKLRCQVDWRTCPSEVQAGFDATPLTPYEEKLYRFYDLNLSYGLYQQLVAPVAQPLKDVKRLYVTTSGALGDIPIAMLTQSPAPKGADFADPKVLLNASWLANRFAVTTLPAVSALRLKALTARAPVRTATVFRGYGDPLLDGSNLTNGGYGFFRGAAGGALADPNQLQTLPPLPGTRTELAAMAGLFGEAGEALQLGKAATETALRQDQLIRTANVIAFATHGLLPSKHFKLDEPGLVFTPPDRPSSSDDGILTASEASTLSLSAEWVILSACNTASTADGAGGSDNLSALSRGFLYAGAHALLASHWRVSDEATAALTVETLSARRMNPALTRGQALQQAMIAIRTGKRMDGTPVANWSEEWVHPSAWAAFSHIANTDD